MAASAHNPLAAKGGSQFTAYVAHSDSESDSDSDSEEEEIIVEEDSSLLTTKLTTKQKNCKHRFRYSENKKGLYVASACIRCGILHPYLDGPAALGTLSSCASRVFHPRNTQCPHCKKTMRPDNLKRHINSVHSKHKSASTYNRNRRGLEQNDE